MRAFNYRLLIDALSDRGFEHCKSQVYPFRALRGDFA